MIAIQKGQYFSEKHAVGEEDDNMVLMTQYFTQIQYWKIYKIFNYLYLHSQFKGTKWFTTTYRPFIGKPEDQNGIFFCV